MTKQWVILPDAFFAGHCTDGSHNKIWAACLAQEQEEGQENASSNDVIYLCVYGPYGAAPRVEAPQKFSLVDGRKIWQKKSREKQGKGYRQVDFQSFLPSFGRPFGQDLVFSGVPGQAMAENANAAISSTAGGDPEPPKLPYSAALVKAISLVQANRQLRDPHFGVSEKVNGERCLVMFDGQLLTAYNRQGRRTSVPPDSALALMRLGHPFIVDGERLTGALAGNYVLFDLLMWNGEDVRELPYAQRLARLAGGLYQAHLLHQPQTTPTLQLAQENSAVPGLALLQAVVDQPGAASVFGEVQSMGGEGIVFREFAGPYYACSTKYKFLDDIDVIVYGIQPGSVSGSLKMALVRSSDQALLDIGHVRAGLTNQDIRKVEALLAQETFLVFKVEYLPIRTVGISLVEPRTSMTLLRTDKDPAECTSDQFPAEKADLIAQAIPIVGITLKKSRGSETVPPLPTTLF
jgi:hypothetical protein